MTNPSIYEQFTTQDQALYHKQGWVHLKQVIANDHLQTLKTAWDQLASNYATDLAIERERYLTVISQWRDLWKQNRLFFDLLENHLASIAAASFGLKGVRLLHDHFIRKHGQQGNGIIPWHQDSMYWPVDRTGMSTWLAMDDAPLNGGCLQVISGSHQWPSSEPVDFMQAETTFPNAEITSIPAAAGDVILLNSKTWHRSHATTLPQSRLAHIALWVPEQTRYNPEKASWHPLNEQVTVKASERLNEDEFPIFGQREISTGNSESNAHQGIDRPHGMFNARQQIEKQVQEISGSDDLLSKLLEHPKLRGEIAQRLSQRSDTSDREALSIVEDVWISAAAYEQHRGRNVFNGAYARWMDTFK